MIYDTLLLCCCVLWRLRRSRQRHREELEHSDEAGTRDWGNEKRLLVRDVQGSEEAHSQD